MPRHKEPPPPELPSAGMRRQIRLNRGISREQAALMIHVTTRTLYRWEHGETPNPNNHRRYASILGQWEQETVALRVDEAMSVLKKLKGNHVR